MSQRTNPYELPALIGSVLDPSFAGIFSSDFIVCSELFDLYILHRLLELVAELGLAEMLAGGVSVERIAAEKHYADQAIVPLRWLAERLAAEGLSALPVAAPDQFKSEALSIDAHCLPAFAMADEIAAHWSEFLHGRKTGEEILFAPQCARLWPQYFDNGNILYAVNNRLGAEAVRRVLSGGAVRILELGGGMGSGALALMDMLIASDNIQRLDTYCFTDLIPAFSRRAERTLTSAFPGTPFVFRKADLNQSLVQQGIEPESFDIVYAVNVVHLAVDLADSLAYIREILRPGGAAVFSECIRPHAGQPVYTEFLFNLLGQFRNVKLDPETRPVAGFLTPENWRNALAAAAFHNVTIVPNIQEIAAVYPYFFAAAVIAQLG